ncbi:MAG: type II secretion system F family protein [Actinomycetota bacterium]|nr:type II secretion system F family protein [Actinomycetota bacterium]
MTAVVLPGVWALALMVGAWRHRPPPRRLLTMVKSQRSGRRRQSPVTQLGALIRRTVGREPDVARDRRVGWAAAGTGLALVVSPIAAVAVGAISILAGGAAGQRRRRVHEARIVASLPETIDLFMLAAGAGLPVQRALAVVAARADGPVGAELQAAARRVELGARTTEALEAVAEALGDSVRPLVSALCASERYGTPLVAALERLAIEARTDQRRRAEEAARRVPVRLLFPLVLCTLPAFALLTVVPLLIGAFATLRL